MLPACFSGVRAAHGECLPRVRYAHGSQYLTEYFQGQSHFHGFKPRLASVGEPETNGVVEGFNGTLKEQIIHRSTYRNRPNWRRLSPPSSKPTTANSASKHCRQKVPLNPGATILHPPFSPPD